MKIVEIRGYQLEAVMPRPVRNAVGTIDSRNALVIELVTDSGLSGWGETQRYPAPIWSFIESRLAGSVLGRSPFDINPIWRQLINPWLRGDVAMMAASAIDIALWDLRGRVEGLPIATLLGGALRDRVRAYASGPFMAFGDDPYRDVLRDVETYYDAGFTAVKIRAGHSPRADAEIMRRIRSEFGPDQVLMMDVNTAYSPATAAELAQRCEPLSLAWIEEPLDSFDLDGYVRLSSQSNTAIAAGEALSELRDFREFAARRAVAVLQPDLYLCGGFTGASKIAAVAEAYSTPVVPHVFGSFINFYAALQFAAILPSYRISDDLTYPIFEFDRADNPLRSLPEDAALNTDGTLNIPAGAGLGVDIERAMFEPYVTRSWHLEL